MRGLTHVYPLCEEVTGCTGRNGNRQCEALDNDLPEKPWVCSYVDVTLTHTEIRHTLNKNGIWVSGAAGYLFFFDGGQMYSIKLPCGITKAWYLIVDPGLLVQSSWFGTAFGSSSISNTEISKIQELSTRTPYSTRTGEYDYPQSTEPPKAHWKGNNYDIWL